MASIYEKVRKFCCEAINMANRSDDRSVGLRTRSSSQAQDLSTEIRDLIQKEIGNFLKSSDFRELLKDAVKDAIRDEIVKATGH